MATELQVRLRHSTISRNIDTSIADVQMVGVLAASAHVRNVIDRVLMMPPLSLTSLMLFLE